MHIPLNSIHLYLGAPIMGGVAFEIFRRNRKQPNTTTNYLFVSFLFFTIDMLCFGLPALFTRDPFILSLGTFVGDCCYAIALLFLWLICFRTYLTTKPRLKLIATALLYLLTITMMIEAIPRNLRLPYGTHIIDTAHHGIALIYKDTVAYKAMYSISSFVFLWIGYLFWKQAESAPTKTQKWRIRSLAIVALLGATSFVIAPALPIEKQLMITTILYSLGFLIVLGTALLSILIKPKNV